MKAMFQYMGTRTDLDSREENLSTQQVEFLQSCEDRGVTEYVVPADRLLVQIAKRTAVGYLLIGRDIEIAPHLVYDPIFEGFKS